MGSQDADNVSISGGTVNATLLQQGGVQALVLDMSAKGSLAAATGAGAIGELTVGANNKILRADSGQSTGLEWATIQGTSNQITVTHNASDITLSAPQDIHTGASPTFVTAKLSGLTDGYVPYHVADATGLADSPLYTDGTSVGIGKVPSAAFDVEGGVRGTSVQGYNTSETNVTAGILTNADQPAGGETTQTVNLTYQLMFGGATPALRTAATIAVGKDSDWTTNPNTDSYLSFTIRADNALIELARFSSDSSAWFVGDVSALSFTDRTPAYTGADALKEISLIKSKDGQIDHSTLPTFAKANSQRKRIIVGPKTPLSKEEAIESYQAEEPVLVEREGKLKPKIIGYSGKPTFKLEGGEVKEIRAPVYETKPVTKWRLKKGCHFDDETGTFYREPQTVETYTEEGRSLGAMISIHDAALQQIKERLEALEVR
ncbi:MAG: hypothetical protein CVU57_20325 [Deltaproteobacteria bacterium HGW-Deltaproteobacteria-15]|jgi:hypothetical protein|nr:MAG: hypothetical protein CVU57_20325 [Deltaproteobacteria bacterium HGW-Deltaproteobacteria-15]